MLLSEQFITEKLADRPKSQKYKDARKTRHRESWEEYKFNRSSLNKAWHKGQISTKGLDDMNKKLKSNLKNKLKQHDADLAKEFGSRKVNPKYVKVGAGVVAGVGLASLAYNRYKKHKEEKENENDQ